ncbi:MAG: ABC transporter ATP-binding protein/permease [Clostridia bacterium]|nr:ABC transporter ATP-binding protein/permease [Clostridia bacterium]
MLELKNIVKYYGQGDNRVLALNGVSLSFRKSEFVSILGPSGCGKTTLLNIIGGLDRYTDGDIRIDGVSTKRFKDKDWDVYRNHSIGFVFQSYNLIPHLSVVENVEMALNIGGEDVKTRREKAMTALEKVGLKEQAKKKPNQLSGGQMQRVAIARAIITDPDIILADEPTGALDSVTGIQVMDILKELSKERLIIMVTHNPELAALYSTRTIELKDGKVVGDSNEYIPEEKEENKVVSGKTAMSFFTAVKSSLLNLASKRARTLLTCVASSIGIIGIALILSVSNGMKGYMSSMQQDSLGEYPISVSAISFDFATMFSGFGGGNTPSGTDNTQIRNYPKYPTDQSIIPYKNEMTDILKSMITHSAIDEHFLDYISKIDPEMLTAIQFYRDIKAHVVVYEKSQQGDEIGNLLDIEAAKWQEILDNLEYMKTQYDVINEGGRFPEKADEIAIVVDKYNRLNVEILDALGIPYIPAEDGLGYVDVPFSEFLNVNMGVVFNDDYYEYDEGKGIFLESDKVGAPAELYEGSYKLKVTAILRSNKNTSMGWLSSGVAYTPALTKLIIENGKQSKIAKAQTAAYEKYLEDVKTDDNAYMVDVRTGKKATNQWAMIINLASSMGFADFKEVFNMDGKIMYEETMRNLGATDIPAIVYFYPSDFQNKEKLVSYLEAYNDGKEENEKVYVTDSTAAMIGMVQNMINAITYVLIAFSAISLVVSSVMIAIITYISVMERTKEIGVLRAMGARKIDVSRIFNAETLIIGLASGIFAIIVTYLLDLILSLVLLKLTGIASLAVLSPLNALILVAISVFLTVIAGLIPAFSASRKDPVNALRSE